MNDELLTPEEKRKSIRQIVVYVLCFVVIGTVLVVALPDYRVEVLAITFLVFALTSLLILSYQIGLLWDHPSHSGTMRSVAKAMLAALFIGPISGLYDAIRAKDWREVALGVFVAVPILLIVFCTPFFLARSIYRHRSRGHNEEA